MRVILRDVLLGTLILATVCLLNTGSLAAQTVVVPAAVRDASQPEKGLESEPEDGKPAGTRPSGGKTAFIFGVSWQPGFCETHAKRPECASQTADRPDARQFSLHGLWPVKMRYCGVVADLRARDRKGDWLSLPAVALDEDTTRRLQLAMPGRQSGLDRHQWVRSGTCAAEPADRYFKRQLRYLDALNASAVQRLFADRLGQEVTEREVKQAFDTTFGKGAGDRVRMRCEKDGDRMLVTGLTIGLSAAHPGASPGQTVSATSAQGDATRPAEAAADLGARMLEAGTTDFKCSRGTVDAAGLQ